MDEPTSGLDYGSSRQLIRISNNLESSKIIATHDLAFAGIACDSAVV